LACPSFQGRNLGTKPDYVEVGLARHYGVRDLTRGGGGGVEPGRPAEKKAG